MRIEPLWVRVNNRWRRAYRKLSHPTGDRYVLEPVYGEPDTVLVRQIELGMWRKGRQPEPKLVS